MHETNHPPPFQIISSIFLSFPNTAQESIAHAKTVGYILLILRLYQLSNLGVEPRNSVNPEMKKNRESPIAPP